MRLASNQIGDTARPSWWIRNRFSTTLKDSTRGGHRRLARGRTAFTQSKRSASNDYDDVRSTSYAVFCVTRDGGYVSIADPQVLWDWTVRDVRVCDDA